MFTKREDKPQHLYVTNRPRWASLCIDLIAPIACFGGLVQMVLYPNAWQVTFVAGVVAFGIINHARYDTKQVEDDAELFATIMSAVPSHKMMDVAGVAATMALEHARSNIPEVEGAQPGGLGVDMDVNGEKYVLLFATRQHFDKMTDGRVKRGAPDLRVIH